MMSIDVNLNVNVNFNVNFLVNLENRVKYGSRRHEERDQKEILEESRHSLVKM